MTTPTVTLSEAQLQEQIVQLAGLCGWRRLHVRRSVGRRRGGAAWQTTTSIRGWVDLLMWNPKRGVVIAAELKSEKGQPTPEQTLLLEELNRCGVPAFLWRPSDWPRDRSDPEGGPVSDEPAEMIPYEVAESAPRLVGLDA